MSAATRTRGHRAAPLPACLTGPRSTQLLVELAHDLRSPLTAILTLAESMQDGLGGPLTEMQRQQLRLIHESALRLCGTTSDALELARGDAGPAERARPLRVRRILAEVRATVMPMAEERGVPVVIACEVPGVRHGAERALKRTLLNLTTNALKVTTAGEVRLSARPARGGKVTFCVSDTGPGLTLQALRVLWRPFRPTAEGPHAVFSSAGLGLAICRKLVGEMGGELTVRSVLGRGSRFQFTVPLPHAPE